MKKWSFAAVSLLSSSVAFSGAMGPVAAPIPAPVPMIPPIPAPIWLSGLFLGLGGSFNLTNFNQDFNGELISKVGCPSCQGPIVIVGDINGRGKLKLNNNRSVFAPNVQAGYISNFENNFWGVKYLYQYLNATSNYKFVSAPLQGTYTSTLGDGIVTGRVSAEFLQTQVNQEMMLLAFIGRSFTNSGVYLGLGPALLETRSHISGISAEASTAPIVYNFLITGSSNTASNTNWIWGGAAQIGYSYFLGPTWFIDFNYTYALAANFKNKNSSRFRTIANGSQGLLVNEGTLSWSTNNRVAAQGCNLTINKVFPL